MGPGIVRLVIAHLCTSRIHVAHSSSPALPGRILRIGMIPMCAQGQKSRRVRKGFLCYVTLGVTLMPVCTVPAVAQGPWRLQWRGGFTLADVASTSRGSAAGATALRGRQIAIESQADWYPFVLPLRRDSDAAAAVLPPAVNTPLGPKTPLASVPQKAVGRGQPPPTRPWGLRTELWASPMATRTAVECPLVVEDGTCGTGTVQTRSAGVALSALWRTQVPGTTLGLTPFVTLYGFQWLEQKKNVEWPTGMGGQSLHFWRLGTQIDMPLSPVLQWSAMAQLVPLARGTLRTEKGAGGLVEAAKVSRFLGVDIRGHVELLINEWPAFSGGAWPTRLASVRALVGGRLFREAAAASGRGGTITVTRLGWGGMLGAALQFR